MANKLTAKQEAFAQSYIKTSNASEAYRKHYNVGKNVTDESIHVQACVLLKNNKVAIRVNELQERLAKKNAVTLESLTKELEGAVQLALAEKQPSALTGAIMAKAKIHGLDVNKIDLTGQVNIVIDSKNKDL